MEDKLGGLLFDQEFLRKLERMAFILKKARTGRYSGQHRSPRKGQSVEFADYRTYVPGDDWRQVDWNAYARLERLFVKLFMEEQDLAVSLLLDTSGSMGWGDGSKLELARKLAAALGYLALVNTEQVGVTALNKGAASWLPVQRSKAGVGRVWDFLRNLESGGETDLNKALRQAGRFIRRPGIAVLLSDFLSPSGYSEGLKYLQHLGQQVVVLHIMHREERDPGLLGSFRLLDSETGQAKDVSISPMLLQQYRQQVEAFVEGIRHFCSRREISYINVGAEEDLEKILFRSLRYMSILA